MNVPGHPEAGCDVSKPQPRLARILLVVTEDWFALSHFKPLLMELRVLAREVVIAARSSGRHAELEALGVRVLDFDMKRGSFNPFKLAAIRKKMAAVIDIERPDVIHAVSLQPMVMASLGVQAAPHQTIAIVLHITGLGYIATSRSLKAWLARKLAFSIIRRSIADIRVWILGENPDDIQFAVSRGIGSASQSTLVPGAGVDPEEFPMQPPPHNTPPRAAYVGRLIRSKGVETLVAAHQLLRERGVALDLVIYGAPDPHNPDAVASELLSEWKKRPGLSCPGFVTDVRNVWRDVDIAVVPSLGGEGVPRALLEAAASGRPVVASDVSGCKQFLRDGKEGALVPPGDVNRLADALERLAKDPELRRCQGVAARERLLAGYTAVAVQNAIRDAYVAILRMQ